MFQNGCVESILPKVAFSIKEPSKNSLSVAFKVRTLPILVQVKNEDIKLKILKVIGDSDRYGLVKSPVLLGHEIGLIKVLQLDKLVLLKNDRV